MKKICFLLLGILLTGVAVVLVFFAIAGIKAYRPQTVETLYSNDSAPSYSLDTLTLTTWNIGYAAMDSTADFFMDGGKMVQNSAAQVQHNLLHIAESLQTMQSDFILLQEVDVDGKRSYHTRQLAFIHRYLADYQCFFAHNFKTFFVPIPLLQAIGKVESGLVLFTRWQPKSVQRWAYPNNKPIPTRWLDIQRCFMVCRFALTGGNELVVVNTHNSAFDNGNARADEMRFLQSFLQNEAAQGNYIITGGDWNQTPPNYPLVGTPEYTPYAIPADFLLPHWTLACDPHHPTCRFANAPYHAGKSLTTTVDFFVLSPQFVPTNVVSLPQNFAHSDHEPVSISIGVRDKLK
ncbi:endonuclease [Bacteroidia bacterium]|nr:endonuclease [Bacteroidia bacterium]